ncbi:phosphatidate cytidylyltransferase [Terasakiella sp. A23]|uniref:phosphatidate cytidylyltransferase n=1 Tax=Terasakiella sp. FCG-A23 TaxID=3080561 RepID=UPI00295580FE|nr:phosphatidate cytidylyltransferase [Terasakiella sp. A23]MDV7338865.1 phosphatidate cytidylyltransferase [Terasakiella sp. A23]
MSSSKTNGLVLRFISALIIAGPAIAAIYYGAPYYNIMISLLGVLMAWEWSKLCLGDFKLPGILLAAFAGFIPALQFFDLALLEALLIAPVIFALLFALSLSSKGRLWFAIGAIYLAIPICAFIFLRSAEEIGVGVVFWIAFMVAATDTGGYAFGLTIGGPKLAPRISPKKTWAGLLGGMLGAFVTGFIFSQIFDWSSPWAVSILSAGLAVIAQMGDLFESHVKRRFDVKDSSQIIPGHGGVLDRLDGMLAAAAAMAGLILVTDGQILTWF